MAVSHNMILLMLTPQTDCEYVICSDYHLLLWCRHYKASRVTTKISSAASGRGLRLIIVDVKNIGDVRPKTANHTLKWLYVRD